MTKKIIYWTSTILLSGMMIMSAVAYFTNPEVADGFARMGFKDFFRQELGIAKVIGAIVLLIPSVPVKIREWAFAGFGITFISAFIAHISMGDPISVALFPLVALGILIMSHLFYHKIYVREAGKKN